MGTPEAVRLEPASAGPEVIVDLALLGLALFLITRLWIMVAPELGRLLARWTLLLALQLVIVLGVVVYLTGRLSKELFDGLGGTAFLLCGPMGVVWVAFLAVRVLRRRRGRAGQVHRRKDPSHREWPRVGLASASVLGLVVLVQWQLSREETKALGRRATALRKSIHALEVTEKKAEEFAREQELLAEKIDILLRITPREPSVEAFVTRLTAVASEYGLDVRSWQAGAGAAEGLLSQHWLRLTLEGDLRRLPELIQRSHELSRLNVWQVASVRGSIVEARLVLYHAPDAEVAAPGSLCTHRPSKVWLWPYSARRQAGRDEIEGLCSEQARHHDTQVQVDDFMSKNARLLDLVAAIERVRGQAKSPAITAEP